MCKHVCERVFQSALIANRSITDFGSFKKKKCFKKKKNKQKTMATNWSTEIFWI